MLRVLRRNDVNVEHTGTRKKQRARVLDRFIAIDRAASNAATNWWVDQEEESEK